MVLTHINHIVERFRLNIQSFGEHIQFLSRIHYQLRIRQIHQFFVTVRPAITSLADSRRNRIGLQNHPVQIIVTLLDILKYSHSVVQTTGKYIILCQKTAVLNS